MKIKVVFLLIVFFFAFFYGHEIPKDLTLVAQEVPSKGYKTVFLDKHLSLDDINAYRFRNSVLITWKEVPWFNSSESLIQGFRDAGIPIENYIIFNDYNDLHGLFAGRQEDCLEKIIFTDARIATDKDHSIVNCIELYSQPYGAEARIKQIKDYQTQSYATVEYVYQRENLVLILSRELSPDQAAAYEAVLMAE
jgi:hypothetical protein